MDGRTKDSAGNGGGLIGLSLWIAAAAAVAWTMLWLVSGNFASSLVAVLAAMTFLVVRLSGPASGQREAESLATARPASLEG
jgi:hypothetical protein